jgi:pSer/pThr/pTyr-binding forkhead associated (FHA) protein
MKQLLVISGKDQGRTFVLPEEGDLPLGRAGSAETRLNDLSVSRLHAVLTVKAGRVVLTDRKSSQGTFVNNEPVTSRQLEPGDVIRLGATELRLEDDDIGLMKTVAGSPEEVMRLLAQAQAGRAAAAPAPPAPPVPAASRPAAPPVVTIRVRCACGQELLARERYAGAEVGCPHCGALLKLPGRPKVVRPDGDNEPWQPVATPPLPPTAAPPARRFNVSLVVAVASVVLLLLALVVTAIGLFTDRPAAAGGPRPPAATKKEG